MKNLYLILIALLISSNEYSAQFIANPGTYNWTDLAAWTDDNGNNPALVLPGPGDVVKIVEDTYLTVTSSVTINNITTYDVINSSITIQSAGSLTTSSTSLLIINGPFDIINNGTLNFFGLILIVSDQTNIINNNILNINTELNINTTGGDFNLINNSGGTSNINELILKTSFQNIMIVINGGDVNCQKLNLKPQIGSSSINYDLSTSNGNLNISKSIITSADYTINGGSAGSTVNFNGTAAQTFKPYPSNQFHNLKSSNPAGVTLTAAIPTGMVTNLLETSATGVLNQGGFAIDVPGINNEGTINADAAFKVGTLDYNSAGSFNSSGNLDIEGDWNNTGTYTSAGSKINIAGDWNNSGTFTHLPGDSVVFDGIVTGSTLTGATDFSELVINQPGLTTTVASGSSVGIIEFLTVAAGTLNAASGANVTLKSTATKTAQLTELGANASYTGDLTVERYLAVAANNGWREITSPVAGTTLLDWKNNGVIFTGFPGAPYTGSNWFGWVNTYTFNEANTATLRADGWVGASNITDATGFAKGHRIYMGTKDENLSVKGVPVQKTQSVTITNNNPGNDEFGWNLIGNPYASTIDWDSIYVNSTNVHNAIWIWNGTAGNYGSTASGQSAHGVTNEIAHSQAFWVYANAATGSVNFDESDKVRSDKAIVKSNSFVENVRIKLTGAVNTFSDEAILFFNENATENYDAGIDHYKMYTELPALAPSLAFVTNDSKDLIFAGMNELKSRSIPIKAFAGTSAYGTYTIEFDLTANALLNSCITLEDLETGTITDLKSVNSYTFTTTANSPQTRFMLHIINPYETQAVSPTCYNQADGIVTLEGTNVDGYTFTIANAGGVIDNVVATSNSVNFYNLASGVYTITSSQSNTCGNTTVEVTVEDPIEVVAAFSLTDYVVYLGQNATITPQNNSNGTTYTWNFGDGTTSTDANPTHTYTYPGFYTVTLTSESNGCSATTTHNVEVKSTTGINELNGINYTVISTDNNIQVALEQDVLNGVVTLTTINGKVVYKSEMSGRNALINTNEIASGIYLITIGLKDTQATQKVLIK